MSEIQPETQSVHLRKYTFKVSFHVDVVIMMVT